MRHIYKSTKCYIDLADVSGVSLPTIRVRGNIVTLGFDIQIINNITTYEYPVEVQQAHDNEYEEIYHFVTLDNGEIILITLLTSDHVPQLKETYQAFFEIYDDFITRWTNSK